MHKVIYPALIWLLLAPISVFGQMGDEVHYSQIWIDDREANPVDGSQGRLYISGAAITQDDTNPFNHQYRTTVMLTSTNGQSAYGDGGASFLWNGVPGGFSLAATHITTCPICICEWANYSGYEASVAAPTYTQLYYNFDSIGVILPSYKVCNYAICEWSKNCQCYNFFRSRTTYTCECQTPCPIGLVEEFAINTFTIPFFGVSTYCTYYSKRPLSWDPCQPAVGIPPGCSITANPQLPYP